MCGQGLSEQTTIAQETVPGTDKCDYTKLKSFCPAKEAKRLDRQPTEWGEIFPSYISYLWLISRIKIRLQKHPQTVN